MKILFFLDVKLVKKNGKYYTTGAVDARYLEMHKIKENDEIIVICREDTKCYFQDEKLALSTNKNTTFITIKKYSEFYEKELQEKIREVVKECDLCYIKLPSYIGVMAYSLVEKKHKKIIVEMVSCAWDSLWNYGKWKAKILAPVFYFINRYFVKKAKYVIYVSNEFLQRRYPNNKKNIACSDVNIPKVTEQVLESRIKKIENKKQDEVYKLGIIGSLDVAYKGHETAIKAISSLKNKVKLELHFLGAGNRQKWIELSKKYRVEENVIFNGTLPRGEAVYNWMDELDLYLIPSYTEGLPRALIEAMSRGCPTIGSDAGGIPELIGKENIFHKKKEKELADKILELITNQNKMIDLAQTNFTKSMEFESQKLYNKRNEFYKEVFEEKNDRKTN